MVGQYIMPAIEICSDSPPTTTSSLTNGIPPKIFRAEPLPVWRVLALGVILHLSWRGSDATIAA